MNWSDQEAIKNLQRSERVGTRLVRGVMWAVFAVLLLSIVIFVLGSIGMASLEPFVTDEFVGR